MKISSIQIGERHRKDLGDLTSLAESIQTEGLLQPIGVTATGELVFGERRLKACELLGWTEISTRIVNVSSIAAGEYAENEMRKNFSPTERLAIATTLHEESPEKWTDETAAKQAGLGSAASMYNVKRTVKSGVPELVEAMDRGEVGVTAAGYVSELPAQEQRKVLDEGPEAVKKVFRAARTSNRRPQKEGAEAARNGKQEPTHPELRRRPKKERAEQLNRTVAALETHVAGLAEICRDTVSDPRSAEWIKRLTVVRREVTAVIHHLERTTVAA